MVQVEVKGTAGECQLSATASAVAFKGWLAVRDIEDDLPLSAVDVMSDEESEGEESASDDADKAAPRKSKKERREVEAAQLKALSQGAEVRQLLMMKLFLSPECSQPHRRSAHSSCSHQPQFRDMIGSASQREVKIIQGICEPYAQRWQPIKSSPVMRAWSV